MIKKIFSVFLVSVMLSLLCCIKVGADVGGISASSAILVEKGSMRVLYERNAHNKMPMASTTKIMTTILLIESGGLDRQVTITPEMLAGFEGSAVGLRAGNILTCEDLAYGMMLASGNDAANAAAVFVAGSLEAFADMMNAKAAELGMNDTHFVTPSGLDADEHYSTAYDMALLASYAMQNETFAQIAGTKVHPITVGDPAQTVYFSNHNRLLKTYEGATGVKTGFTKKSGRCLVSSAERNGVELIAVTLKAPDDWNDHKELFDYGFSILKPFDMLITLPKNTLPVAGGQQMNIPITLQPTTVAISDGEQDKITSKIFLPKFVYAPVSEGETVGFVEYYLEDRLLGSAEIKAAQGTQSANISEKSIFEKMLGWLYILLAS